MIKKNKQGSNVLIKQFTNGTVTVITEFYKLERVALGQLCSIFDGQPSSNEADFPLI